MLRVLTASQKKLRSKREEKKEDERQQVKEEALNQELRAVRRQLVEKDWLATGRGLGEKPSFEGQWEAARMARNEQNEMRLYFPYQTEGVFSWRVMVKRIREKRLFSPWTSVDGLPFRLLCKKGDDGKSLDVFLRCDGRMGDRWTFSALVDGQISLVANLGQSNMVRGRNMQFSAWECSSDAISFSDPSKGFVDESGYITIKARIRVIWYYKNAIADFASPDARLSDVTLLVGDEEFRVNKNFISYFSGFFKALLSSHWVEPNKDVFEVALPEGVEADDFDEMLRIVYPRWHHSEIDNIETVKKMLILDDYFDVPLVRWKCVDFIIRELSFSQRWDEWKDLPALLLLVGKHQLKETLDYFQDWCCSRGMRMASESPLFDSFSDDVKAAVRAGMAPPPYINSTVKFASPESYYTNAVADFSSAAPLSDVTLLVGGKELHSNKALLSHFSEHFEALFTSNKELDRVELPQDVDAGEFEQILRMIYPQRKQTKVTAENVLSLVRLGCRFGFQTVVWRCIDFLMDDEEDDRHYKEIPFSYEEQFILADECRLPELIYEVLLKMNVSQEEEEQYETFSYVVSSDDFRRLSDPLQVILLKNAVERGVYFNDCNEVELPPDWEKQMQQWEYSDDEMEEESNEDGEEEDEDEEDEDEEDEDEEDEDEKVEVEEESNEDEEEEDEEEEDDDEEEEEVEEEEVEEVQDSSDGDYSSSDSESVPLPDGDEE